VPGKDTPKQRRRFVPRNADSVGHHLGWRGMTPS
jgi:hypothetical protein